MEEITKEEIYAREEEKSAKVKKEAGLKAIAEGLVVWFVRNGQNKLTAMLPEDY